MLGDYPVARLVLGSSACHVILCLMQLACPVVLSLMELCLSKDLGFCSPFYLGYFALHPGIACLGYVHYGVACLASQASFWAGALWNGL